MMDENEEKKMYLIGIYQSIFIWLNTRKNMYKKNFRIC